MAHITPVAGLLLENAPVTGNGLLEIPKGYACNCSTDYIAKPTVVKRTAASNTPLTQTNLTLLEYVTVTAKDVARKEYFNADKSPYLYNADNLDSLTLLNARFAEMMGRYLTSADNGRPGDCNVTEPTPGTANLVFEVYMETANVVVNSITANGATVNFA